jgi:hypothetical protein
LRSPLWLVRALLHSPSPVRQCRHRATRSGRRVRLVPAAGIGREVAGGGMAVAGFGAAEDGAKVSDPARAIDVGRMVYSSAGWCDVTGIAAMRSSID